MALTATIHQFAVELADTDRGCYASFELRLARHPSETAEFMLTRLLAYCLEYVEGIALSDGVAAVEEPAVLVRDLTGRITAWIEVGAPDAERLHRGAKLAGRAAVYTHRDPAQLLAQLQQRKIHRGDQIPVSSFEHGFLAAAAAVVDRRNRAIVSVTGGHLYLELNGGSFNSALRRDRLAPA